MKERRGRWEEELEKKQRRKRGHQKEEEEERKVKRKRSSKEAQTERKLLFVSLRHRHHRQPMGEQEAESLLPGPAPCHHSRSVSAGE